MKVCNGARIVGWAFLAGMISVPAYAANTIRVPSQQPTIQAGIDAAMNGDKVLVAQGTYYEHLNFHGKAITVTSSLGPNGTIVDGSKTGPVVVFNTQEQTSSVLHGFTLRNGVSTFDSGYDGGGIRISGSSPTIVGNIITQNLAQDGGGGIAVSFGSPVIKSNFINYNGQQQGYSGGTGGGGINLVGAGSAVIVGNHIQHNSWSTASGGGIALFAAGTPFIQNNYIQSNSAYNQGGGISLVNVSDANIVQNVITGNVAQQGGGIYWLVPSGARGPLLVNDTIADNQAGLGSGLYVSGFQGQSQVINCIISSPAGQTAVYGERFNSDELPTFQYNDVFTPGGSAYGGNVPNQTGTHGNISVDPLFTSHSAFSLLAGSPCLDAGYNSAPMLPLKAINGTSRIYDGDTDNDETVDLGAYEKSSL